MGQKKKNKWLVKSILALFVFSFFQGWFLLFPTKLESATLTNAKDTVVNSRLSYSSALEGNHSVDDTTVDIDTSNYPDQDTNHLFPGDTAHIGSHDYTVGTIIDSDTFTITTGLQSGDTADDTKIYVDQTSKHTITFTTTSAVADGAIRVSVPASGNDTTDSDGNPDDNGFDLNSVSDSDVNCPDATGYDFDNTDETATDAGGGSWHTFECRYSGSGNTSTALTMTIGSSQYLLNSAPESGHSPGIADDYTIRIQNLDSSYSAVDAVDVKIVMVEAVRVTATVEESLSFTIAGRSSGNTHCNVAADVTTQAYSVPFDSLASANSFVDTAQQLNVSTNADDGYEIRVYEDDELGLNGADSPYIPDTSCDSSCDHTTTDDWTTASNNGFGYSLEEVSGTDAKFEWEDSTWYAKHFPNYTDGATEHADTNAEVMSNAGPVDDNAIYVCYRISVSGTQEAGDYYNTIKYIATPQF